MRKGFLAAACAAVLSSTAAEAAPPTWLDRSFGSDGLALQDFVGRPQTSAQALKILADGSILVTGVRTDGYHVTPRVTRLHPDGTLDTAFGSNGVSEIALDPTTFPNGVGIFGITVLPDGGIVLAGNVTSSQPTWFFTTRVFVARLTASGMLDTTFGNGAGFLTYDFAPFNATAYLSPVGAIAADADGGVLLGTSKGPGQWALVRIFANGTIDEDYGTAGSSAIGPLSINRIIVDDTNRAYLSGASMLSGRLDLFRMLPQGTLDASFGEAGATTVHIGEPGDLAMPGSLMLDREGRPVVGYAPSPQGSGSVTALTMNVARFTGNGSVDATFNDDAQQDGGPGKAAISNPGPMNSMTYAVPNAGGDIMMVGHSLLGDGIEGPTLLRLLGNAASDPAFTALAPSGEPWPLRVFPQSTATDYATAMGVDAQGRIVLAGRSFIEGQRGCMFVMRIIPDRLFAEGSDPSSAPNACPD